MGFHFENWSSDGLSNFEKAISKIKIHWIKELLIPLEIS